MIGAQRPAEARRLIAASERTHERSDGGALPGAENARAGGASAMTIGARAVAQTPWLIAVTGRRANKAHQGACAESPGTTTAGAKRRPSTKSGAGGTSG